MNHQENQDRNSFIDSHFTIGQSVVYVGDRYPMYRGMKLTVYSQTTGFYCCKKPDGYLTTWINPVELQLEF